MAVIATRAMRWLKPDDRCPIQGVPAKSSSSQVQSSTSKDKPLPRRRHKQGPIGTSKWQAPLQAKPTRSFNSLNKDHQMSSR